MSVWHIRLRYPVGCKASRIQLGPITPPRRTTFRYTFRASRCIVRSASESYDTSANDRKDYRYAKIIE